MCCNNKVKNIVRRLKILYKDKSLNEILDDRGIVLCPISGDNISRGAYKMYAGIQYIYVNEALSDVDTYDLKSSNCTYFLTRYENQADIFAAEYLLPDSIIDDINSSMFEVGEGKSIYDIARDYHVSEELVLIKLTNLDKSKYKNLSSLIESFYLSNALIY
ncbi:MAG: ImmA/IrrE family metallo-endopeptidase [Peptostreptococcaceae bacterium]